MLPRAHLPDQELVLSVVLNKNMTTSAIHPLYLPPVVCWINNTHEQVRFWKLKLYMALRLLSTCLILITTVAHALRLYSWESLSGVAERSSCDLVAIGVHNPDLGFVHRCHVRLETNRLRPQ